MADQFCAVTLCGVVRDAGHRDPPHCLTTLFAGEGEFEHPREGDGVVEEAFEKIPQPIEQHPIGMSALELYVVAQHRREVLRIHLAVVAPCRFIVVV